MGCYYWLSLYVVRLVKEVLLSGDVRLTPLLKIPLHILLVGFVVAFATNVATYFAHPHFFNYGGWRSLAILGYNEQPLTVIWFGLDRAVILILIYVVYGFVREAIITGIDKNTNHQLFRTMVVNQIALVVIIYFSLLAIFGVFDVAFSPAIVVVYLAIFPSSLVVFFFNVYLIYPTSNDEPLSLSTLLKVFAIVILSSFSIILFKLSILPGPNVGKIFVTSWIVQFAIVTPLSWLYYKQRKEKFMALRGAEETITRTSADLQLLRAQINPHFLFNALNTLYGTALRENAPNAAEGIQKLGDMMRFMLHENHQDFIALDKEIAYIDNYVSLQKLRLLENVQVTVDIDELHCGEKKISPMLLITFIENAFKHGISMTMPSWIKVELRCTHERLEFTVRNSISASKANDPEKHSSGIGLENVRQRLVLFYPNQHEMTTSVVENEYIAKLSLELR
ncbi:histidine kinase [Pseudochryseolinea flava]|uniref:Histidine kinase n=2 Tax=Pseudochryseolinea flava TaxID=2059302 RepID=A0A364Y2X6_9BACT|nr:histidine kinase [Pseudochryseolinea flava]